MGEFEGGGREPNVERILDQLVPCRGTLTSDHHKLSLVPQFPHLNIGMTHFSRVLIWSFLSASSIATFSEPSRSFLISFAMRPVLMSPWVMLKRIPVIQKRCEVSVIFLACSGSRRRNLTELSCKLYVQSRNYLGVYQHSLKWTYWLTSIEGLERRINVPRRSYQE